jgi:hypothetical protein
VILWKFVSEFEAKEPANEAGSPVVMVLMLQVCTISAPEVILSLENVINVNHLVDFAVVYLRSKVICLPQKIIVLYVF